MDGLEGIIEAADSTPAESAPPASAPAEGSAATSDNDWLDDISAPLSRLSEPKTAKKPAEPRPEPKEKPAEKAAATEDPKPVEPKAEKQEEETTEKPEKPTRVYTITDPAGQEVESALPEGAKIRFKADDKEVEATFDELVSHAQQGVHAQRKLSKMGQEISVERRKAANLETTLTQREQEHQEEINASRKLMRLILSDPEAADKIEAELAKWEDPEYREGMEARDRERRRQATESSQDGAQKEEIWNQFWTEAAPSEFDRALPEFELLRESDRQEVLAEFHAGYARAYNTAAAGFEKRGIPKEKVHALADEVAMGVLTEENLRAAMKRKNDSLSERLGPIKRTREHEAETRLATEHNQRTDARIERTEKAPRPLGSGGGGDATPAPSGTKATSTESGSMSELLDDISGLLSGVGKP